MRYRFADITFNINCESYPYFINRCREYEMCDDRRNLFDVDIDIVERDNIEDVEAQRVRNTVYGLASDGSYLMKDFRDGKVVNIACIDKELKKAKIILKRNTDGAYDKGVKIFAILYYIFALVLYKRKGIILHASAIDYKDRAILFTAPSGTGKSTQTALWCDNVKDVFVINDDTPALRIIDGIVYVYGTPWSGTSAINKNCRVQYAATVNIIRAKVNSIIKTDKEAMLYYFTLATRSVPFTDLMSHYYDVIGILTDKPNFVLSCNVSEDAVFTAKEIIDESLEL